MARRMKPGPILARRLERAKQFGDTEAIEHLSRLLAKHRFCDTCGRSLTDPDSIDRGRGPECLRRSA